MNLTQVAIAGSTWQFASVSLRTICQLVVIALLARILAPTDFGLVAMANLLIAFGTLVSRLGFGLALIQRKNLTDIHVRVAFTFSVLLAIIFVILFWLFAPVIAFFFQDPSLSIVIRLLSFSFLFSNLGAVASALLQRDFHFKALFWPILCAYVFGYALFGIGMALLGFRVWSLVGAFLAASFIQSAVLIWLRPHPMAFSLAIKELKELARFGGGVTLSNLFNYGASNGDYIVVGRWLGAGALGIYEQAFRIMLLPARYVGDILENVLFAAASTVQEEMSRTGTAFLRLASIMNLCLLPLSAAMIVVAPELVVTFLGSNWKDAILPARILLLSVSFANLARASDAFARASGAVYRLAARKGLYALGIFAGAFLGQNKGLPGVASAVTMVIIMNFLSMSQLVLGISGASLTEYMRALKPGLLLGSFSFVVCYIIANVFRSITSSPLVISGCTITIDFFIVFGLFVLVPQCCPKHWPWFITNVRAFFSKT